MPQEKCVSERKTCSTTDMILCSQLLAQVEHPSSTGSSAADQIRKENQELREKKQCRVCRDRKISAIFEPCLHLVACSNCASDLKVCPKCDVEITAVNTIYFWSHEKKILLENGNLNTDRTNSVQIELGSRKKMST